MTILRPYIYRHTPYRPPPLYQGLRSRVLQGHRDPGSRVTMGHRVTGSQGHGVMGHQGYWVTWVYHPRFLHYPYLQGHHGLGSRVTMGYHYPGLGSPWVTGSPLTLTRVTPHHGSRVSGHRVSMVIGSPITRDLESPITRVTGLPSPWSSLIVLSCFHSQLLLT